MRYSFDFKAEYVAFGDAIKELLFLRTCPPEGH